MTESEVLAQVGGNQFCGSYRALPPNGNNPDSLVYDRFGNAFDFDDLAIPLSPLGSALGGCNSGYFNITWVGSPPQNPQAIVCQVMEYVSSIIQHRQGETDCGLLPFQSVNIQVGWISFSNPNPSVAAALQLDLTNPLPSLAAGIGTPFYPDPVDPFCKVVELDRPFIKINGGKPIGFMFDGRIILNSDTPWNYNTTAQIFTGIDIYTTILHETMHIYTRSLR